MNLRAKFKCVSVTPTSSTYAGEVNVELQAVTADNPENQSWSKATPSGNLKMFISNPDAVGALEKGKEYFIDISPVEEGA